MIKYRGKYILEGLNEIPPGMMADLDLSYDICKRLHDSARCEMCGRCCSQANITVMDSETGRIAEHLRMDENTFINQYLYRRDGVWLFRKSGRCKFLTNDNKCAIWSERPEICRDFPYLVSKFMSRVYLSIVNGTRAELGYMEDSWPCTPVIKSAVGGMIDEARRKRKERLDAGGTTDNRTR